MAESHTYYLAAQKTVIGPLADELTPTLVGLYMRYAGDYITRYDGASAFLIDGKMRFVVVRYQESPDKPERSGPVGMEVTIC